jgi:hypothetical protein
MGSGNGWVVGSLVFTGILAGLSAQAEPVGTLAPEAVAPGLRLEATVEPLRGALTTPRDFRLRLINDNPHPVSVLLGSCPVRYEIDGTFSPGWTCEGPSHTRDLAPGEAILFGPAKDPRLRFEPPVYPLSPGEHRVQLLIAGVGEAETSFLVESPEGDGAFVAVRLAELDGSPPGPGTVELLTSGPGHSRTRDGGGLYQARVGREGYALFAGILPGRYQLRARVGDVVRWYPDLEDQVESPPLEMTSGYQGPIEVLFPGSQAASPPTHRLRGRVYLRERGGSAFPLADAAVVAIPAVPFPRPVPQASSPLFGDPATREFWSRFAARTGRDGSFLLEVPPGRYRLLAGKLAVTGYRYWPRAPQVSGGAWIQVPEDPPPAEGYRFELSPLGDLRRVQGRVTRVDPFGTSPPAPVGGAVISAHPLLPSSEGAPTPQRTSTTASGTYVLELPSDTPYLLRAAGSGCRVAWYPDAYRVPDAVPFDPASSTARSPVDFLVAPALPPAQGMSVDGEAQIPGPPGDCPDPRAEAGCPRPAGGARVRATALAPGPASISFSTRTDAEGRFHLEGLPAGSAEEPGYRLHVRSLAGRSSTRLSPLPAEPGGHLDVGRILLQPEDEEGRGWLEGKVTDEAGAPIEGAIVRAYRWPPSDRGPGIEAETDARGTFRITRLSNGESFLLAAQQQGFVPAYYPGVSRWARAEPVWAREAGEGPDPIRLTLAAAASGDGGLLAVRVEAAGEAKAPASAGTPPAPLEGAFIFATRADAAGPDAPVVTGSATGPAGTALLILPEGEMILHIDHPGMEPLTSEPEPLFPRGRDASSTVVRNFLLHPPLPADASGVDPPRRVTDLHSLPNPFQARTSLRYRLEESALVRIQLFDYRGRLVRTLVEGEEQNPGAQSVLWDGADEDGRRVSSGVYFFRVQAGPETASHKIVLLP